MANPRIKKAFHLLRGALAALAALLLTAVRRPWALLRVALSGGLVWILVLDNPARLLRLQLAAMPGLDYSANAERLYADQRYTEALMVLDKGLENADDEERRELAALRQLVVAERRSVLRRVKEGAKGAVTGRGESFEALIGAVGTDFFIVGDIRDLAIEGTKQAVDGESDKLILGLSGLGVLTSLASSGLWGIPAEMGVNILKIARKTCNLSRKMVDKLTALVKKARHTKNYDDVAKVATDTAALARHGGPSFAIHTLKHVDSPADLAKLSRQIDKRGDLAFAVHVTKGEGVAQLVKHGDQAADAVAAAAKHGDHGRAWLRTRNWRLFKPHPLIGLGKGLRKGTVPRLLQRAANESDRYGSHLIAGAVLWFCLEALLLGHRFLRALGRSHVRKPNPIVENSDSQTIAPMPAKSV